MTPVEEFVFNSDKLKTLILDEALRENNTLREQVADLRAEIGTLIQRLTMTQSKMAALESVNARLLATIDDHK